MEIKNKTAVNISSNTKIFILILIDLCLQMYVIYIKQYAQFLCFLKKTKFCPILAAEYEQFHFRPRQSMRFPGV
jgi:hypothetical protein